MAAEKQDATNHGIDVAAGLGHDWLSIVGAAAVRSSEEEPFATLCVALLALVIIVVVVANCVTRIATWDRAKVHMAKFKAERMSARSLSQGQGQKRPPRDRGKKAAAPLMSNQEGSP